MAMSNEAIVNVVLCCAELCHESFISHLYKHDATLNSSYYTITHGSIQSHYQFVSVFTEMELDLDLQGNVKGKKQISCNLKKKELMDQVP